MNLSSIFRRRPTASEAASALGRLGGQASARRRREPILARARQLRAELGMKPAPALERSADA